MLFIIYNAEGLEKARLESPQNILQNFFIFQSPWNVRAWNNHDQSDVTGLNTKNIAFFIFTLWPDNQ